MKQQRTNTIDKMRQSASLLKTAAAPTDLFFTLTSSSVQSKIFKQEQIKNAN